MGETDCLTVNGLVIDLCDVMQILIDELDKLKAKHELEGEQMDDHSILMYGLFIFTKAVKIGSEKARERVDETIKEVNKTIEKINTFKGKLFELLPEKGEA